MCRVQAIRVQPDKLTKLPGENNYELTALKRAQVDGWVEVGGKKGKFQLRVDYRARLLIVDARKSPIPAIAIAEALAAEFSRITHMGEPMFLLEAHESGKVLTFTLEVDPLGVLHRTKEIGGFVQEVPESMIHESGPQS